MMALYLFIGILILLVLLLIGIFNKFVSNRNLVKDAWSNIDVALKRRHDLIPNLVNTVKGYAAHESETLSKVTEARNSAMNAPKGDINAQIQAENALQGTLKSLFAVAEAYPDLKANAGFLDLQQQLNAIEENLERSRRYYNSTVRVNNVYGESFPGVIFAGMFNYQHFDYFEVDAVARENVTVDFS
ncbi:MAG TPA: LemA family protein [Moheibacter sp.]|nr:LemA family protein [Moheibacter sp.]